MAKSATSKVTQEKIIELYMNYVLENETVPKSVFKFCKENSVGEEEFYAFFGSLEGLQKSIWNQFFANTLSVMQKNPDYDSMSNEDKMLTFFFTFFEALTLNRSYVLFALKEHHNAMERHSQLKDLRKSIKKFASELIEERNSDKNLKILKQSPQIFSEGAWFQFLFLLKFWMGDSSPGFEKTDIAIEKSVTTIFQVFENTPLEKIIDFGKFLYKESFA
ncbi:MULTISPECIES: TetR family transcriptional regulator C-terminal domain-containing protein [Flavobacteriaceae]|uniref:TetR family transcriptional regulator C-terminal domain-containing protein n=1 Tax=Flavobacteriaceae TaxID=49546 RepID=UPI001491BDA3|nr:MULTISPECIES: TetR family transcriptional regulator C-terminal domain-containing protein [Allomuricauda]MDC6367740.1 TetR family transcriptional regulator C-terminal domain-containing protein [Muricauda sp. AC10]